MIDNRFTYKPYRVIIPISGAKVKLFPPSFLENNSFHPPL